MEKLKISSTKAFAIDQFMLANDQFLSAISADNEKKTEDAIKKFGGCTFNLENGDYCVYRDPNEGLMVVYPIAHLNEESIEGMASLTDLDDSLDFQVSSAVEQRSPEKNVGRVFIDTRCVVFADLKLLGNSELLKKFGTLREKGQEKEARDLLRKNRATVRYGFQRFGDELGVAELDSKRLIALWPDVIEAD